MAKKKWEATVELFGWIATCCLVSAFYLNTIYVLKATDLTYQALNLIGGIGIMTVSAYKKTWQPAVVNGIWTIIAIVGIVRMLF